MDKDIFDGITMFLYDQTEEKSNKVTTIKNLLDEPMRMNLRTAKTVCEYVAIRNVIDSGTFKYLPQNLQTMLIQSHNDYSEKPEVKALDHMVLMD